MQKTQTYECSVRGTDGKFKSIYSSWLAIKNATDAGEITDKIVEGVVCSC